MESMIDTVRFLNELRQATSWDSARRGLHLLLTNLSDQISNGFGQLNVQTSGKVQPPDPIEKLSVVASNGTVHAVLTHNAPVHKNVKYFVEASANDPSFGKPGATHVFDLGASRTLFAPLPSKDNSGANINWYFRAYPQYHGSDPAPHTTFGGKFTPTPIVVGGTSQFTPLASTGSGTAAPNGSQAGQGLGIDLNRAALGPKRSVAPSAA